MILPRSDAQWITHPTSQTDKKEYAIHGSHEGFRLLNIGRFQL